MITNTHTHKLGVVGGEGEGRDLVWGFYSVFVKEEERRGKIFGSGPGGGSIVTIAMVLVV